MGDWPRGAKAKSAILLGLTGAPIPFPIQEKGIPTVKIVHAKGKAHVAVARRRQHFAYIGKPLASGIKFGGSPWTLALRWRG